MVPPSRLMALLGQVILEKCFGSYVSFCRSLPHKTNYDVVDSPAL